MYAYFFPLGLKVAESRRTLVDTVLRIQSLTPAILMFLCLPSLLYILPFQASARDQNPDSGAKTPIRVAVIIPLSGPVAPFGQAVHNGIQLALKDASKANISRVRFSFYDNAFSVSRSVSIANELLSSRFSSPHVIISIDATHGNALRPLTEAKRILHLSASSDSQSLSGSEFTFQTWSNGAEEGALLAKAAKDKSVSSVATVLTPGDYHQALAEGFASSLSSAIHHRQFTIPAHSSEALSTLALRLRQQEFDTVLLLGNPGMASDFSKRAESINYRPLYLSGIQLESQKESKLSPSLLGAQYVTRDFSQAFACKYQSAFRSTSLMSLAALHFDLANMLLSFADLETSADLKKYISDYKIPDGASGVVAFQNHGSHYAIEAALTIRTLGLHRPCSDQGLMESEKQ